MPPLFTHVCVRSFFDQTSTGDLITRLTSDVQLLQSALTTDILNAARSTIMATGGVGFMVYTSPFLTAVSLMSLPPIFVSARFFGKQIKKLQGDVQKELGFTTTKAEEVISNIKTVRSFAAESIEVTDYSQRVARVKDRAISAGLKGAFLDGSVHVAANAGLLCILAVGGNMMGVGGGEAQMTVGGLSSFLMYSLFVAGNVTGLSTVYGNLQKSSGAAARIFEIIDREPSIVEPSVVSQLDSSSALEVQVRRASAKTCQDDGKCDRSGEANWALRTRSLLNPVGGFKRVAFKRVALSRSLWTGRSEPVGSKRTKSGSKSRKEEPKTRY